MKKTVVIFLTAAMLFAGCTAQTVPQSVPQLSRNSPVPTELSAKKNIDPQKETEEIQPSDDAYKPFNYDTQKAVWISYIDLADMLAESENEFAENIGEAFENVSKLGCNTVYVHARAFGDAYYASSLYAPNELIAAGDGGLLYDPLEIMTDTAHKYGLSFHAWINPMRCDTADGMERMEGTAIYEWYSSPDEYGEYVFLDDNGYYWLNPSKPDVRGLIAEGAAEIAENYDVDGIHIDDYFYPTTDESFDRDSYAQADTGLSLSDWRLNNCSEMVKEIYGAVKSVDEDILFGVSPQGNMNNNYTQMYADVKKWCSEKGYIDYIAPQIYFGYENEVCPFTETLAEWENSVAGDSVKLVCGLGFYKLDRDSEFTDTRGIIARQISDVLDDEKCSGFAIYSYEGLFRSENERFTEEREAIAVQLSDGK